jgi:DNA-binding GntR family transcriptional regulator
MDDRATSSAPRQVLSHRIAAALEEEVLRGDLGGGARLDEATLAQRFGVSRTPIREALQIVVARGLGTRQPYKGVIVSEVSAERIAQLFEAMGELEALCGRFAAERMTMAERTALLSQHQDMAAHVKAGAADAYEAANTAFHQMIYRGSHNADLVEMAEAMRTKLAPFRRSQLSERERMARSDAEHARIVEAVMERDGAEAERALRRHLVSAAQAMQGR